jgi:hypothetical protein
MSNDVFGKSETEKLRAELVSSMVQRALRERGQLVPTIMDVSSLAQPGLDTISFPRRQGNFVVQNLNEDSEADIQSFSYDLDKLELEEHAIVAWSVKKRADKQSMVNLEADTILQAAGEHSIDVDRKIIAAMKASASSANDVAITGAWTTSKLLEMKAKLQKSTKLRPNQANFFCLVSSARESELLDLPRFVEADKYGSNTPLISGELGRAYGIRFLVTDEPVLGDDLALGWVQEGIVYGNQMSPDYRELYIPKKAAKDCAIDQLYGVKVLDEGKYISKVTFSSGM